MNYNTGYNGAKMLPNVQSLLYRKGQTIDNKTFVHS